MLTILRTGVGSPASISTIKSLQKEGVRVVGIDVQQDAVGFYFCDVSYQVPMAEDPHYIKRVLEICEMEKVNAILPAVDEELVALTKHRDSFEEKDIFLIAPSYEVAKICFDKWLTYKFFVQHGFQTPKTIDAFDADLDTITFPQIIKPRCGRGSKGIYYVSSFQELGFFRNRVNSPLLQEYLDGKEHTIDILSDLEGRILTVVPRERIKAINGISNKGRTVYNKEMIEHAKKIAMELKLIGPSNIQCFLSANGDIKFTEINPRLAGSIALSEAAGAKIIHNLVKLLKGEKVEVGVSDKCEQFEEGVLMLRFWEEMFNMPRASLL